MKALLIGSILSLSSFVSPLFADDAAAGFAQEILPFPGQSLTATLADGSILSFDGIDLNHSDSSGNLLQTLASLPNFAFGSFLRTSPAEDFVVLGENSLGNIYRVAIDGSAITLITTLTFNYDAVFEGPNSMIVSAATGGFGSNSLLRLNLNSGSSTLLASLAGASGPLALDTDGSLFYGTSSAVFPAPAGSTNILRFDVGLLDGSNLLDETDASIVCSGFDNATALVFDSLHSDLFVAEVNSNLGINQIRRVGDTPALSPVLLVGDAGTFLSNLEYFVGDGQSKMRAFQPADGGRLHYNSTNFFSIFTRNSLEPLRAQLSLSGPGTMGLGQLDLGVIGGQPNGTALIFYGPSSQVITPEFAINLQLLDFPLLFGVNPGTVSRLAATIPLDANGNGQISLDNPTGQTGFLAIQALHTSSPGLKGTSTLSLF